MADIEIHRVHGLGLKAARTAAERMAEHLGRKFDLKGAWEGNVLRFERPGVSGSLAVTAEDLRLSVALGFLLKAMKGSIEKSIEHELDSIFAQQPKAEASKPAKPAKPPVKKGPAAKKTGGP
jgi:putative polyhydroxyalkanoate system protein